MNGVKASIGVVVFISTLVGCQPVSPVEGIWVLRDNTSEGVKPCRRLEITQDTLRCDRYAFRSSYTLENGIVTVVLPLGSDAKTQYKLVDDNTLQLKAAQGVIHTYSKE